MDEQELLIANGGAIKAAADGKIGGYLVRFSNQDSPDLTGEFFTADTDYDLKDGERTTIYYHHGQDATLGKSVIGEGALKIDGVGVWLDGQLDMRDRYIAALARRLEQDEAASKVNFGLSSGTAPHLVEREAMERSVWLKRWPLRLDASITPTPAEPTTRVVTLKAYTEQATSGFEIKALLPEDPAQKAVSADAVAEPVKPKTRKHATGGGTMKIVASGGKFYCYLTDDAGETLGHPVDSFEKREDADKFRDDYNAPQEVKTAKAIAAAVREELQPLVKAMGATTPGGKGMSLGGYAQAKKEPTLDEFLKAVMQNNRKAIAAMGSEYTEYDTKDAYATEESMKVLGDQTGVSGGFLIPTQFVAELIKYDPESTIVWPRARTITMQNRSLQIPGVALTGQTAGVSNFFGGFLPQWNETGTLKPETEPEFRQIELVAHELSAYTEIKDAMIQDSPIAIAQFLRENGRDALMFYSDEAFLDGTGAGMPQGIITAPGTLTIARDTAGTIVYEDVKTMFMHAVASGRARSVWICNQMIMTQLMDMVDPAGNLIWQPSARDGLPGRMLGLPVLWTEKTPTLGTAGDIILADFQHYIIGRKEDVSIGMSEHYRFRYNRTAFRFVLRVDGQEDLTAPIYLKSGVDQVSPFVILGGAATT